MSAVAEGALYRLLSWMSPAYPVGGFSYSHGLEWAVEAGLVTTAEQLRAWVATILGEGSGRVDAALLAAAYRAKQDQELDEVAELAAALRGTRELALESAQQGAAFLTITRAAWPHPRLDAFAERHAGEAALPVAVGLAAAAHGVPLEPALAAYLHAFGSGLVSAGIRLIPLGQTDGQRVVAALEPVIAAAARRARETPLDHIGAATPMVDLSSMQHETQHTRLFRS
ncbi:urease accessory protein UreF [Sorangium sp. So ce131]|uniref:urease accessory protein UreF n=1 Tax=Sorangium sp. So ce131 TaxID=3133282 RepID=UPI003F60B612